MVRILEKERQKERKRKKGRVTNRKRLHVPLRKKEREAKRETQEEKREIPRCQQEGAGTRKERGVEVLGVLFVGRGAGIQGNGLFLIIQTPPTNTEEAPTRPHDNFILTY